MRRLLAVLLLALIVSACDGGPRFFRSGADEEDCAIPPGAVESSSDEYDDVYVC